MKKSILYTICGVAVVAAIVATLIFIFVSINKKPDAEKPNLIGTWTVAAIYENDKPIFTDKQYMVFSKDNAAMYKDGNSEPFASSSYSINKANKLLLPDISHKYKVDKKTDNCIRLYETATKYMLLVRNSTAAPAKTPVRVADFEGKWNVIMKGDLLNSGERFEFSKTSLKYYKADSNKPFAATTFYVTEGFIFNAQNLGLTMRCYPISSSDTFVLIEDSGTVWEIKKEQIGLF